MGDFPKVIDYNHDVICLTSPECLGTQIASTGLTYTTATAYPSANLAQYVPFLVGYPITIQKMFWENGATVGNNNVDVGIYDSQGNQLTHSGSTLTSGATSTQSVSVGPVTLEQGLYYMAMAVDGTTDTFLSLSSTIASPQMRSFGIYQQASAFALPSTATFAVNTQNNSQMFGMSAKSIV